MPGCNLLLTLIGGDDTRHRGLSVGEENREELQLCDVQRRSQWLSGLVVKFLFFTVIYVISSDCLPGFNPWQWRYKLLMCKAAQLSEAFHWLSHKCFQFVHNIYW